jgi:TonB family protein
MFREPLHGVLPPNTALEPNLPPRAPIDLVNIWQLVWVLRLTTVAGKSAQRQNVRWQALALDRLTARHATFLIACVAWCGLSFYVWYAGIHWYLDKIDPYSPRKVAAAISENCETDSAIEKVPAIRVAPRYPVQASTSGTEGWVELEIAVTADGRVLEVAVLQSTPEGVFEQAAIAAVEQWRYCPVDPETHREPLQVRLKFQLDPSPPLSFTFEMQQHSFS